jgi:hypothetical protein
VAWIWHSTHSVSLHWVNSHIQALFYLWGLNPRILWNLFVYAINYHQEQCTVAKLIKRIRKIRRFCISFLCRICLSFRTPTCNVWSLEVRCPFHTMWLAVTDKNDNSRHCLSCFQHTKTSNSFVSLISPKAKPTIELAKSCCMAAFRIPLTKRVCS